MSTQTFTTIPDEVMPALQGIIPTILATCDAQGVPNITGVTQAYYVDEYHIAFSNQFFNKTVENITANPVISVILACPVKYVMYKAVVSYVGAQTSGDVYEKMKLQLEVIAAMQGMQDVFLLKAAEVFKVISIEKL